MAIKEEDDPINNKPDSNGESKISEPKEECLSEPEEGPSEMMNAYWAVRVMPTIRKEKTCPMKRLFSKKKKSQ